MNTQCTSTNHKIIIFGVNDLAELSWYYFNNDVNYKNQYSVEAFTVNKEYITNTLYKNIPVTPFEDIETSYPPSKYKLFAPIADNKLREKIYTEGKNKGYEFVSYISSKATIFGNEIGENCFILEDNTIQPFTKIGNNVVLWSGNHIGHHGLIEDHVFFTSHVVMSGHCHIKKRAWIGVNATLRDGITIGENSIIGMGSLVTKSVPCNETWLGSPAKRK